MSDMDFILSLEPSTDLERGALCFSTCVSWQHVMVGHGDRGWDMKLHAQSLTI